MIDTVYKNVSDIRSKTPRDYETMVKLEAEFNEVMDKADTKSADINKPQTLKEFLATKMNPKPIDDSSADEDPITGLKRSKRPSKIQKNIAEDFKRDDLKFRTMAKYKAVRDGDILMFDEIDQRVVDLAACKGKALDDSEFEEEEREIEEMLKEEQLEKKQDD